MFSVGCADGNEDQIFKSKKMVGCDGIFTRDTFRSACSVGWRVAKASDYFAYGGKTVQPTKWRFIDVAWDSTGKETSLDNWQGYFDTSCNAGLQSVNRTNYCLWLSGNSSTCYLSFIDHDYGKAYGRHCNEESSAKGVVCVKSSSN